MKKFLWIGLIVLLLAGCAGESKTKETVYTIGISQLAEHPALDAAREGFEDALKEADVKVEVDYKNAQGDVPTAALIAEGFVTDKVDLMYVIATPAAQAAAQTTSEIPILFSAVTDPVQAKLVESDEAPGGNVTGTSDAADIAAQIDLFLQINPDTKTIGIVYNTSESNSEIQVEQVIRAAEEKGIAVETTGVNSVHDIKQATETLAAKIDGLYIPTDNLIANSISIVADICKEFQLPSVSAEAAQVEGGTLITEGLSYYELGKQTGRMAAKILVDQVSPADIPVEYAEVKALTVNKTTAEALGLDLTLPVFADAEFVE